jgi:UDP-galactopyranose mutase
MSRIFLEMDVFFHRPFSYYKNQQIRIPVGRLNLKQVTGSFGKPDSFLNFATLKGGVFI